MRTTLTCLAAIMLVAGGAHADNLPLRGQISVQFGPTPDMDFAYEDADGEAMSMDASDSDMDGVEQFTIDLLPGTPIAMQAAEKQTLLIFITPDFADTGPKGRNVVIVKELVSSGESDPLLVIAENGEADAIDEVRVGQTLAVNNGMIPGLDLQVYTLPTGLNSAADALMIDPAAQTPFTGVAEVTEVVTITPEPTAAALIAVPALTMLTRRRRSARHTIEVRPPPHQPQHA